MKHFFQTGICLVVWLGITWGQNRELDSLRIAAEQPGLADTARIRARVRYVMSLRIYRPQDAEQEITRLCQQADRTGDLLTRALAQGGRGDFAFYHGNYKEAMDIYRATLGMARACPDQREYARILGQVGNTWRNLGSADSARIYLDRALALCKSIGDKKGETGLMNNLGMCHYYAGEYELALKALQESLRGAGKYLDTYRTANVYNNLGLVYDAQGMQQQAIDCYYKSLSLRTALGDSSGQSNTLNNLGLIFNNQGDNRKALECFQQSLALKERMGDKRGLVSGWINSAITYRNMGEPEEALEMLRKALNLSQKISHKLGIAYASRHMAALFVQQKQWDSAAVYIELGLRIAREMQSKERIAHMLLVESDYLLGRGLYAQAYARASEAMELAKPLKNLELQRQALSQQSDAASKVGLYREAYEAHVQYFALTDSVRKQELQQQMLAKELSYRDEKSRMEQEKREIAFQAERTRGRWIVSSLGITFLVTLGAAFLLFRAFRRTKASALQIQEQHGQLMIQAEELGRLNAVKDRLFSILSHDIRAPLGQLHGTLTLVSSGGITEEQKQKMLTGIAKSTQHAIALTDNLLFWARSQMEGFQIKPETFDLHVILHETRELLQPAADQKEIDIQDMTTESPLLVRGDSEMLRLVVRNLLNNAIKFCRKGDTISLNATPDGAWITVQVADTGVGIAPAQLAGIFEGSAVSTPGTANEKGTGLGLQLCREFVEKNGGTIQVASEPGKGSVFSFTVPAA